MFNENWIVSPSASAVACNSDVTLTSQELNTTQTILGAVSILGWVLLRHTSSCEETAYSHSTHPSHYLSVYAHPLPTDAGELAWPARSWYHTPACQRGRSSSQAFLTFFFNRLSADNICLPPWRGPLDISAFLSNLSSASWFVPPYCLGRSPLPESWDIFPHLPFWISIRLKKGAIQGPQPADAFYFCSVKTFLM